MRPQWIRPVNPCVHPAQVLPLGRGGSSLGRSEGQETDHGEFLGVQDETSAIRWFQGAMSYGMLMGCDGYPYCP